MFIFYLAKERNLTRDQNKEAKANVDGKLSQQQEVKKEMLSKRQDQVIIQQQYLALINKIQETVRKNELLIRKRENMQN